MNYYNVRPTQTDVAFTPSHRQRRLTIGFRWILAIPHVIALGFLGIAVWVLAFVGWFGAIFTGHLPESIGSFIAGSLRYLTRVYAYAMLLTDVYPPFSMGLEPDYPVEARPVPQQMTRVTVVFRLILAIPVWILLGFLSGGFYVAAIVVWLVVLINGEPPPALYQALCAVLRFQTRVFGYLGLLTEAYPTDGVFGDRVAYPGLQQPYGAYPQWPYSGYQQQPYGAYPQPPYGGYPQDPYAGYGGYPPPGYPPPAYPPPGYPPPAYPPPAYPPHLGEQPYAGQQPDGTKTTHLVLSRGAKIILAVFIVLGAGQYVAQIVVSNSQSHCSNYSYDNFYNENCNFEVN